ncbi:MAG: galactokinase [Clostridia bacterium]|nr:galactokinase [Clostridia bacterium]
MSDLITLACQVCPRGCFLQAEKGPDGTITVSGNDCYRGKEFATATLSGDLPSEEDADEGPSTRCQKAKEEFFRRFGEEGDVTLFSAPGRSEIGGNHTDHQRGKVLACALDLDVVAAARKTDDGIITVQSEGFEKDSVDLSVLEPVPEEEGTSTALVRGVAAALKEAGHEVGGFQAYTTSDVLPGSGMSSSAAFEVLLGTILSEFYNDGGISPVEVAKASQKAENRFFGKPSGLLDQMTCAVGGLVTIDFADPEAPAVRQLDVDFGAFGHRLCITDTKGSHADLTPEYAAVPEEMKRIAAHFGKEVLQEVGEAEVLSKLPELRELYGDRPVLRALHWYEENKRVDAEVAALEAGDFAAFLKEVKASGDSSYKYLQNVYSPRHPEAQAIPMALAVSDLVLNGRGASRVHGGGFAGTIQAFVPEDLVDDYKKAMDALFGEGACRVLGVRPTGGCKVG